MPRPKARHSFDRLFRTGRLTTPRASVASDAGRGSWRGTSQLGGHTKAADGTRRATARQRRGVVAGDTVDALAGYNSGRSMPDSAGPRDKTAEIAGRCARARIAKRIEIRTAIVRLRPVFCAGGERARQPNAQLPSSICGLAGAKPTHPEKIYGGPAGPHHLGDIPRRRGRRTTHPADRRPRQRAIVGEGWGRGLIRFGGGRGWWAGFLLLIPPAGKT